MRRAPRSVRWRTRALADLERYYDWLKGLERGKPKQTIARIRAAANSLKRLGDIGRPGIEPGVRELSVRNAPDIVVYRVDGDMIDIPAVYHTAQNR